MSDNKVIAILILIALLIPASAVIFCSNDEGITGIVSDVRETRNGYIFNITIPDGTRIKCFIDNPVPVDGAAVTVHGSFSSDGSIFFIDKMIKY